MKENKALCNECKEKLLREKVEQSLRPRFAARKTQKTERCSTPGCPNYFFTESTKD